jgi:predicted membrane-bound spermidine synthase
MEPPLDPVVRLHAAGVAGVAMLALSGLLAPWLGLPRWVLVTMALVNLAYGAFSCSLARQPEAPRRRVRALVVANFAWTGVCVGVAAWFAGPGSWAGAGYVLAEGLFVGTLAAAEASASR